MQIDVISDTVCPWCFIGKRRLARAMAMRPAITFDVKWRPYRLDPTVPRGGMDRKAYMRAKFGEDPMKIVEMHKLIAAEGAKDGIEFDFAAIERRPDTLDSHRLIRWAEATGVQDEVVERLFIAYFENGEDIGDVRVLADIADDGSCVAAKDISMAGLVGSLAMLLEHGRYGVTVDLDFLPRPAGVSLERWLTCFPSFGFLLCVPPGREADCIRPFRQRGLEASVVGEIDSSGQVALRVGPDRVTVIDLSTYTVTGLQRP